MKLKELSPEQKTRMLAELDGYGEAYQLKRLGPLWRTCFGHKTNRKFDTLGNLMDESFYKCYLTSYDAIIPLIQKLDNQQQYKVFAGLQCKPYGETPHQLCDAVLIATGKAEL